MPTPRACLALGIADVALVFSTAQEKFDGETSQELRGGLLRRFRLTHPLPRYLILHYKRFKLNNFFVEKNPTLVTFPVKNLELKDYVDGTPPPSGKQTIGTKFNLVANVCHTGTPEAGKYVCHVLHRATDEWYTVDVSAPPTPHPNLQAREMHLQPAERGSSPSLTRAAIAHRTCQCKKSSLSRWR